MVSLLRTFNRGRSRCKKQKQRHMRMVLIMRMEWNVRHLKKRALTKLPMPPN